MKQCITLLHSKNESLFKQHSTLAMDAVTKEIESKLKDGTFSDIFQVEKCIDSMEEQ